MSRGTVRAAVASWLSPENVPGLANIYQHPAKITNEGEFSLPAGAGFGGLIFIHLETQREKRIALGGAHSGLKWRPYGVVLICFLRSNSKLAQDAGVANDLFLDAIVTQIEADRQLGTAGAVAPVFQAGEGDEQGGDDIEVVAALPRPMEGGITQVFSTVKFQAAEIIFT